MADLPPYTAHAAARADSIDLMRWVEGKDPASLWAVDPSTRWWPIHAACESGSAEIAAYLLRRMDEEGSKPPGGLTLLLEIATRNNHPHIIRLLARHHGEARVRAQVGAAVAMAIACKASSALEALLMANVVPLDSELVQAQGALVLRGNPSAALLLASSDCGGGPSVDALREARLGTAMRVAYRRLVIAVLAVLTWPSERQDDPLAASVLTLPIELREEVARYIAFRLLAHAIASGEGLAAATGTWWARASRPLALAASVPRLLEADAMKAARRALAFP
jgi:hypothetical protein